MGPGDEVVCVGVERQCPHCGISYSDSREYPLPEVGHHYVVRRAAEGACVGCGHHHPVIRTVGCPLPPPYAWPMSWFRPLEYTEDQHVADAGVTLPVRIEETV